MNDVSIKNKKAFFNYQILETEIAGIVLVGSEVKSIKNSHVNFTDAYCFFSEGEIWIKNLNISEYDNAIDPHEPKRDRKLLMTKKQIIKFQKKVEERGLTMIPLKIFVDKRGIIKLEIGLAKWKKEFDKRSDISKKESDIKIKRIMKEYSK